METSVTSLNGEYRRDNSWIECVLFAPNASEIDSERLSVLVDEFARVTIASIDDNPGRLSEKIRWHRYDPELEGRASVWNKLLAKATSDWVLFLESGESLSFFRLPDEGEMVADSWVAASVQREDEKSVKNFYQVRLIHASAENPFQGWNLPDCTDYIMQNEIHLYDRPIIINRIGNGKADIVEEQELAIRNVPPKIYLLLGERLMDQKKYVQAAAQYRKVLKTEKLLPFDRLAAVNGLSRVYTEQYKWPKALQLTEKAIEAEPVQRIPYLIRFRIHQLNQQWAEAYNSLKEYYDRLNIPSRSSFDIAISEEETLVKLADLALKAGLKEEAFTYNEELYSGKKEEGRQELLRVLLMLAIELGKRERAVHYFNETFRADLPADLSERQAEELNDYMTLFMNNGWYAFASEIYEELYAHNSNDAEYRRRLIVSFSKTDRLDRARKLIAS